VADIHPRLRESGADFPERARQQVGWELERDAHPQRPGARHGLTRDRGERPVVLGEERPGLVEQDRPGVGRRHPAAAALKQLDAELAFQRQDRLRQGGLAYMKRAGGRGETAFLRGRGEGPQLAYFHRPIASQILPSPDPARR